MNDRHCWCLWSWRGLACPGPGRAYEPSSPCRETLPRRQPLSPEPPPFTPASPNVPSGSSPPHTPQAGFSAHQPASALPFPLQTEDLGTLVQLVGGSPPIFILGRVLLKTKGAVGQPHRAGPSSRAKPSGPPAPALVFPYLPGSLMLSPACRSFSLLLL